MGPIAMTAGDSTAGSPATDELCSRRSLRISYRHGNRSGKSFKLRSCSHSVLATVPTISSSTSVTELHRSVNSLGYCLLNIRSVTNKIDDVVELRRDVSADVVCLVETWHDSDGLPLNRLRSMGYTVIDRPRPRLRSDLSSNHGGIIIFTVPGVRLTVLPFESPPSFELLCVRVISGCSSDILVVVYRPGSESVQQQFFGDLSAVLERAATYSAPVYVVGDFNIRLDRQEDPITQQFCSLLSGFGLNIADTGPTHSRGGALDAVASTFPVVADVIDVGLSDHHAVCWRSHRSSVPPSASPGPQPELIRPWRRLDMAAFRVAISESRLCRPETWPIGIDDLCGLYNGELRTILDRLVPLRPASTRRRPSDPWFNDECRAAKRATRRLERAYTASCRRCRSSTGSSTPTTTGRLVATAAAAKAAWYSQRRLYRQLRHRKCQEFWQERIEAARSNPRQLWHTVDRILGRNKTPPSDLIAVEEFHSFFDDKVGRIRDATSGSPPPAFSDVSADIRLSDFTTVAVSDIVAAISRLPDKASAADPLPTSVLKAVSDLVAPYITELFNRLMVAGHFPHEFKHAYITPIVKKAGLDSADVGSYRPIANLSVLSKLFERVVARQLRNYLHINNLLPTFQSGFRPGHSTETAILRVLSDILAAVDRGDFAVLVLLDLSTAFNTVDHDILLERLQRTFGFNGNVLRWMASYLTGRSECVRRGSSCSETSGLVCGVPQGSVLGPLLFLMYTVDLIKLILQHGLTPHLYADDTQIYGGCRSTEVESFSRKVAACVAEVATWMRCNRLQLNVDKTELIWFATSRRLPQLPTSAIPIGGHDIVPSTSVRNLGVYFDADLSMRRHIDIISGRCFAALRQLRGIRRYVTAPVLRSLVTSLILTRLDYCNSALFGLPAVRLARLQSIQNAAARLVFNLRRTDHITDALICLHWLRVAERIRFKIAVMVYRCLHGQSPAYMTNFTLASVGRANLRSAASHRLVIPRTRLSTIGDRAFPVAGATVWNSLPDDIISSPTIHIFRSRLKTYLFRYSFPGAVV